MPARFRLPARLQYGGGLRVSELVRLRILNLDFDRGQIQVKDGKGGTDRNGPARGVAVRFEGAGRARAYGSCANSLVVVGVCR